MKNNFRLMRAVEEVSKYSVRGVGRVGSLAKARSGRYSRSRKHWEIQVRIDLPGAKHPDPACRWDAVEAFGTFKRKMDAEAFLLELYRQVAEYRLLYAIVVAGKSAKFAERAMKKFLMFREGDETPLAYIRRLEYSKMAARVRQAGTGNYRRIISAFWEVAKRDIYDWSLEELEKIDGIGPKTSRFWMKWAMGEYDHAILDTHILKWLKYLGYKVPKSTPSQPRYDEIEAIYIREVKERFDYRWGSADTMIWEFCRDGGHKTGNWPEELKRKDS